MSELAINVSNLGKQYSIGKKKDGSLRGTLASIFKSSASKGEDFWALRNINFEVQQGDIVGIIGKNGAGKRVVKFLTLQKIPMAP